MLFIPLIPLGLIGGKAAKATRNLFLENKKKEESSLKCDGKKD
jgi:hypothetical protein